MSSSTTKPRDPLSGEEDALNLLGGKAPGEDGEQASGQNGSDQDPDPGPQTKPGPKKKPSRPRLLSLVDRLLASAASRIGYVLRPYPKDVSKADIESALDTLKQRGLIHYPSEHPNLTQAGIIVARGIED
jgi:hypothetical protein